MPLPLRRAGDVGRASLFALLFASGCSCSVPPTDVETDVSVEDASVDGQTLDVGPAHDAGRTRDGGPMIHTRADTGLVDDGGADAAAPTPVLPTFGTLAWHAHVATGPEETPGNVIPTALALDADGRAYVGLAFEGTATFSPARELRALGSTDGAVACYENDGSFGWARHVAGNTVSPVTGLVLHEDSVLVTGQFDERCDEGPIDCEGYRDVTIASGEADATALRAEGPVDLFLAELTRAGAITRAERFGGPGGAMQTVLAARGGQAYLAGVYFGVRTALPGGAREADGIDGFVSRLTIGGPFESASLLTTFGGPDETSDDGVDPDMPRAIDVGAGGECALGGHIGSVTTFGPGVSADVPPATAFVASYDASGTARWVATIGGAAGLADVSGVRFDADGGIWFTGVYHGTASVRDAGGTVRSLPTALPTNTFLGHLDSAGSLTQLLVTVDGIMSRLALLPSGAPVLLQTLSQSTSLPSADDSSWPIHVRSESIVAVARYREDAKLDAVVLIEATGAVGAALGHVIATDESGRILIAGRFAGDLTLGSGRTDAATFSTVDDLGFDAFVARIDEGER